MANQLQSHCWVSTTAAAVAAAAIAAFVVVAAAASFASAELAIAGNLKKSNIKTYI